MNLTDCMEEKYWTKIANDQLLGKKITNVRYMSTEESEGLGWSQRSVVIELDDGNIFYASADDEGNNGGSIFTNNQANPILPVLRG